MKRAQELFLGFPSVLRAEIAQGFPIFSAEDVFFYAIIIFNPEKKT